jgi:hypothetical protein
MSLRAIGWTGYAMSGMLAANLIGASNCSTAMGGRRLALVSRWKTHSNLHGRTQMAQVSDTLDERGSRYGDFFEHAIIAQTIQSVMRGTDGIRTNWDGLSPDMCQALTVIADKIARILNGDPTYLDNWHDIQGYARLVERRLEKEIFGDGDPL